MLNRGIIIGLLILPAVFLFQNCGGVNFTSNSTLAAGKVTGDGGEVGTEIGTDSEDPGGNGGKVYAQDIIECVLVRNNAKVVLSSDLVAGSNSSETRICMARASCLETINDYARVRDCSLSVGKPSSSDQGSCTAVFSGSRGSCHNAKVITEPEVKKLLNNMANRI